ncbi:sulfatase-like hydrolase/transferase [Pectobacterium polaris]|uniref:sulfatase-like hydrolase/transferase n=1 Tax=Pectobacterium polaris TaxID=2042057 RepID=UPI0024067DAE|nr:sulfatase-like hydrolase/transferase [Pectobacterium polaris]MDG0799871.1 sulfatase-like hydrolase/transferase [Pectobacterium polaris]
MMKKQVMALSIATALLAGPAVWQAAAAAQAKPNVIILFTDDMGWADMSVQGAKTPTPHLDKLAATGQRWTNFYVSSAISSPSRGGLMTGRVETKTGLYGTKIPGVFMDEDPDGFPDDEVSMAESLQHNGYRTIMYGKWHLGTQSNAFPTRHGFDEWYGIPTSNDRFSTVVDQVEMNRLASTDPKRRELLSKMEAINRTPQQEYWNVPLYHSYKDKGKQVDYAVPQGFQQASFTKDVTNKAVQYIADNKDQPFFMYMAYPQTHVPLFTSPEFKGKGHNPYGDVMLEIDWSVGQIYQALEVNKLAENTIVIFTSDNGPWLQYDKDGLAGSALPLRSGKSTVFEGGQRVPFIVNWKSHIAPKVVDDIGSTLDLLPTLMKITGSQHAQRDLDGVDLSAAFLNGKPSARTFMPYFYWGKMDAYRDGDYKVVFRDKKAGIPVDLEKPLMFNLRDDVSEQHDLSAKEPDRYRALIEKARAYEQSLGEKKPPLFDL